MGQDMRYGYLFYAVTHLLMLGNLWQAKVKWRKLKPHSVSPRFAFRSFGPSKHTLFCVSLEKWSSFSLKGPADLLFQRTGRINENVTKVRLTQWEGISKIWKRREKRRTKSEWLVNRKFERKIFDSRSSLITYCYYVVSAIFSFSKASE